MIEQVSIMLQNIRAKYISNGILTKEEEMLLGDAISVPLLKYVEVSCISGVTHILADAAELVAMSILLRRFTKITDKIFESLHKFEKTGKIHEPVENFKRALQASKTRVSMKLNAIDHAASLRLMQISKALESHARKCNNIGDIYFSQE